MTKIEIDIEVLCFYVLISLATIFFIILYLTKNIKRLNSNIITSQDVITSQEKVRKYLDVVFEASIIHPIYLGQKKSYNHEDDPGCIINDPSVTLKHSLIGLDLKQCLKLIYDSAELQPSPRTKPVLTIVRGQGGGKTRALLEMRKELLETDESSLPIAITFNNKSKLNLKNHDQWNMVNNSEAKYALSIVSRLASALFKNLSFDKCVKLMLTENLNLLNSVEEIGIDKYII